MSVSEENLGAEGESVLRRRRRGRWSEAQKRQIVAETHGPGVSVPMVAQRYNLNANQEFKWWRLFRKSQPAVGAGRFVPVVVEGAQSHEAGAAAMGRMEIVLSGDRRVIVDRSVDPSALARVIAVLERR